MRVWSVVSLLLACAATSRAQGPPDRSKPLFRDFIGLNVHTVQFRPELYKPVARLLRDYHGFNWDVGEETDHYPQFPLARNGVDWQQLYGDWKKHGYAVDACVQFDAILPPQWIDLPRDAYAYGFQFARYFGPSSRRQLAEAIEIGNEPGKYSDGDYRTLFENAASGIRQADPKLLVATCAVFAKQSGEYHKNVETVKGLEPLYDVLSVHSYPLLENYPTWRRSFPEDPRLDFLQDIHDVILWRDKHAADKQVWLTEFGYDAATRPPDDDGPFSDWVGVTDRQQAQYLVRSLLILSEMALDRAYLFWFNDDDKPQIHGSSGLTRNFQPKPAFFAVAHLAATLGEFRFNRAVVKESGNHFVYEFAHPAGQKVWVAWSPTGNGRTAQVRVRVPALRIERAEKMPLTAGPPEAVSWNVVGSGEVELEIGEDPIYLHIKGS